MLRALVAVYLVLCLGCGSETPPAGDAAVRVGMVAAAVTAPPVQATHDTTLRSTVPYGNDGTGTSLGVSAASVANLERTLLRFDTADMTAAVSGQSLHKATVTLTISSWQVEWLGGQIEILPMVQPWDEGTGLGTFFSPGHGPSWVCADDQNTSLWGNLWNDCVGDDWAMLPTDPGTMPFATTATDIAPVFTGGLATVEFDVTSDVALFLAGAANHGWMLRGTNSFTSGELVQFASSESATPPLLTIEYGADECLGDPLKGLPGACGCGNPDIDVDGDRVPDCIGPVLEPIGDTTVRLVSPFGNDGTGALLGVTSTSVVGLERSLIRFDQTAIAAAVGSQAVESAQLRLTVAGIALGWGGGTVAVHTVSRDWPEGTGLAGSGPTWACRNDLDTTPLGLLIDNCPPGDEWAMSPRPGVAYPYDLLPLDTAQAFTSDRTITLDVTADVHAFLDGTKTNNGWLIKGDDALLAGEWINFGSRESGTPPRLVLKLQGCPLDPNKEGPGVCGCGIADTDTDSDTTPDCLDECPLDLAKDKRGLCGCGVPDADGDGDGVPDCIDECDADAGRALAGICGCPSDDPAPLGASCNDGVCPGNFECDGSGLCGDPEACSPDPGHCSYTEYDNATYWLCDADDHDDAAGKCLASGGRLARINDSHENRRITSLINAESWIGANSMATYQDWVWMSSDPSVPDDLFWRGQADGSPEGGYYNNWALSQPAGNGSNRCGSILAGTGEWRERSCGASLPYACEVPVQRVPREVPSFDICDFHPSRCPSGPGTGGGSTGGSTPNCIQLADVGMPTVDDIVHCQSCDEFDESTPEFDSCVGERCTGQLAPPGESDTCAFDEVEQNSCSLIPITGQCVDSEGPFCGACEDNSDCAGTVDIAGTPYTFVCDTAYGDYDESGDPTCETHTRCHDDDDNGTVVCEEEGVNCRGVKRCGVRNSFLWQEGEVRGCPDGGEVTYCDEVEVCPLFPVDPNDVIPSGDMFAQGGPPAFDPVADLVIDPAPSPSTEYDVSCEAAAGGANCADPGGAPSCSTVNSQSYASCSGHQWCKYGVENTVADANAGKDTQGESGSGSPIAIEFIPNLEVEYKNTPGPFGLNRFALGANGEFAAELDISLGSIFSMQDFAVIDVGMEAMATQCGLSVEGNLILLGEDLLPAALEYLDSPIELPLEEPGSGIREECLEFYERFETAVSKAKKAYKDAEFLVKKYRGYVEAVEMAVQNTPANQTPNVPRIDAADFCRQAGLDTAPEGFKLPSGVVSCDGITSPRQVVQSYVDYYAGVAIQEVVDAVNDFTQGAASASGNPGLGAGFKLGSDEWVQESQLIASLLFAVGPIPVTMEIEAMLSYGIGGQFRAEADMGGILKSITSPLDDRYEIGSVLATVAPGASAGIGLFVGVGYSIAGIGGATLGVSGEITLAEISLPMTGRAALVVDTESTARAVPAEIATLHAAVPPTLKTKRYNVGLLYDLSANISVSKILQGWLAARLRVSLLFFSKTWKVTILEFNSPIPELDNLSLIPGGVSADPVPLGAVEMPMALANFAELPADPGSASYNSLPPGDLGTLSVPSGQLMYARECTCVPSEAFIASNSVDFKEADRCTVAEDCCDSDLCFSNPATSKNECTGCRMTTESCNEDADCCQQGGVAICHNATCKPPRICGESCDVSTDCQGFDATEVAGRPAMLRCLASGGAKSCRIEDGTCGVQ